MKTAQQAAANWVASAGRAAADWPAGVQAYNGDWAMATVNQQAAMVTNWTTAVNSGAWAAGVNRTGTGGWKSATQAKAANFATGFQAGASNQAAAIAKIINAEQNIVGSLPPRGTYQQNQQRAIDVMNGLHALKGTLGA